MTRPTAWHERNRRVQLDPGNAPASRPRPTGARIVGAIRHGDHTLRPEPSIQWGLGDAAIGYLIALLVSALAVSVMVASGAATASSATKISGALGLWVGFVGAPLLASRLRGTGHPRAEFGLRVVRRDVPLGVGAGVLTQLIVVPALTWPLQQVLGGDVSETARETLGPPGGGRWLMIVLVIVGAPVAEELFFRGLLLRSLARHLADLSAVVGSSALFAATHFQVLPLPGLFAAGAVFATLTWRTGRLGPAIVAHAAFNATAVVALLA